MDRRIEVVEGCRLCGLFECGHGGGFRRVLEPDYEAAEALFDNDFAWILEAAGRNGDNSPRLAVDSLVYRIVGAALSLVDASTPNQ
jgi:hypothetical protein